MAKATNGAKKNAKQEIVDIILQHMEKENCLPWDKGILGKQHWPINTTTGKQYLGINVVTLWANGGGTQEYLTFNQCKEKGGHVKKGAKGLPIVFWKVMEKEDEKTGEVEHIPFLKRFIVFKVSDCEGIKQRREQETRKNVRYPFLDTALQAFFQRTGLGYRESSGTACYRPGEHEVQISPIVEYRSSDHYYATLLHEMVHSTANAMKRKADGAFGSKIYSEEEVVAEIGSMYLCRAFGIEAQQENSAEYVKCWGEHLKKNPDWLIRGASNAHKAFEYIIEQMGIEVDDDGYAVVANPGKALPPAPTMPVPAKTTAVVAANDIPQAMQLSLF